jgi:hypothetical protein
MDSVSAVFPFVVNNHISVQAAAEYVVTVCNTFAVYYEMARLRVLKLVKSG